MKKAPVLLATLVITVACAGLAVAGEGEAGAHHQDVELGCAKCVYHMEGVEHCTVAAKVGDEVMLVKGGGIDAHGLCGRPKMAEITGKMQEGELHASNIELK